MGLGWHPYFPKRPRSRLHIELTDRWESDASGLPTRRVPQPGIDADVSHLAFDHCFEGWRGPARIRDEKLRVGAPVPVYTANFNDGLQGFTGDGLGATQQVSEVLFYLGLALALPTVS